MTAEPRGLELGPSITAIAPQAANQITWRIGSSGFDMNLSGSVPSSIGALSPCHIATILQGRPPDQVCTGRSILAAGACLMQRSTRSISILRRWPRRPGSPTAWLAERTDEALD